MDDKNLGRSEREEGERENCRRAGEQGGRVGGNESRVSRFTNFVKLQRRRKISKTPRDGAELSQETAGEGGRRREKTRTRRHWS
eukprot:747611-Hanusia_phi.AAC.5